MNHLPDDFTHSTIENEDAKDSPTVQLVRFLIDAVHADLINDASSHSTAKVLLNAANWLKVADEELDDDPHDPAYREVIGQADPVITDLTNLLPGSLSLHSLVINWSDGNTQEGTFGTTVRAFGHDHAEYLARREMELSEDGGSDFTGECVDHNTGATWKADELETALRDLVAHFGPMAASSNDAMIRAKALLAELDAL